VTKESMRMGMTLAKHVPVTIADYFILMKDNFTFGDLSRHGIVRPKMGPLLLKSKKGISSVIDVGTVDLIKKEVIKVTISYSPTVISVIIYSYLQVIQTFYLSNQAKYE
jgi:indole-3-pyruvate monooxygenase